MQRRSQQIIQGPVGSLVLLVAFLPVISFLGHWSPRIEIPGTDYFLGAPASHGHYDREAEDHSAHCHESVATCGNTRVTTAAQVVMLEAILLALLLGGMRYRCRESAFSADAEAGPGPELMPPRPFAAWPRFPLPEGMGVAVQPAT